MKDYKVGDLIYMIPEECKGFYSHYAGKIYKIKHLTDQTTAEIDYDGEIIETYYTRFRKVTKLDKVLK